MDEAESGTDMTDENEVEDATCVIDAADAH